MSDFGRMLYDMYEEKRAQQKKRAALLPAFETEEAALEYAKRIANLRPGDVAKVFNEDDTALHSVVFVGYDEDGDPKFLAYDLDTKRLCVQTVSWYAVVAD